MRRSRSSHESENWLLIIEPNYCCCYGGFVLGGCCVNKVLWRLCVCLLALSFFSILVEQRRIGNFLWSLSLCRSVMYFSGNPCKSWFIKSLNFYKKH
jgi:hypothetical protein